MFCTIRPLQFLHWLWWQNEILVRRLSNYQKLFYDVERQECRCGHLARFSRGPRMREAKMGSRVAVAVTLAGDISQRGGFQTGYVIS